MSPSKKKELGLTLLDIGNPSKTIDVGGRDLTVTGISARGALSLFIRFPDLQRYLAGQGFNLPDLVKVAPNAIAAVIAAGTGLPENEEAESIADKLPVDLQIDILNAIWTLTFRSGFGPFVQKVMDLSDGATSAVKSVSTGKAQATNSQPQSKASSQQDTDRKPSGTTPPAK